MFIPRKELLSSLEENGVVNIVQKKDSNPDVSKSVLEQVQVLLQQFPKIQESSTELSPM